MKKKGITFAAVLVLLLAGYLYYQDKNSREAAISEEGILFGEESADISIYFFSSFSCEKCAMMSRNMDEVVKPLVDAGEVRLIYKPTDAYTYKWNRKQFYNWKFLANAYRDWTSYAQIDHWDELEREEQAVRRKIQRTVEEEMEAEAMTALPVFYVNDEKYTGYYSKEQLTEILNRHGTEPVGAKTYNSLLFYSPTCSTCLDIEAEMKNVPDYTRLERLDVSERKNLNLFVKFCEAYQIPERERSLPILFVGENYFSEKDEIEEQISSGQIKKEKTKLQVDTDIEVMGNSTKSISIYYVFLSGLLDGINPCAIAMLILLISLIGFAEKKRNVIIISIAYIAGIFISYYLLGIVLYSTVSYFDFTLLNKIIEVAVLGMCIVLCIVNIRDAVKVKKGKYAEVTLQLPKSVRKLNERIMTRMINHRYGKWMFAAFFGVGVLISFTEFMCTGQIYLPVILTLINTSGNMYLLFLIYNIAFVLPLLVVAGISIVHRSVIGISSKVTEKTYIVKIINAAFYFVLAVLVVWIKR